MDRFSFASLALAAAIAAAPGLAAAGGSGEPAAERRFAEGLAAYDAGRYRAAVRHWRRLAEAGHEDAVIALAGLYRQGLGVTRDPGRAAALYRRAGLRGRAIAQANLAEMLARGEGLAADPPRAWAWFTLAGAGGNPWARRQAARLDQTFSNERRRRARTLLGNLKREIAAAR
ncbi:MAG: sel1 repeat family protein [Alphaproteobacteria bacterium]|nr:sel1 repeat family protein [Alphaproteobacteria bacterium]